MAGARRLPQKGATAAAAAAAAVVAAVVLGAAAVPRAAGDTVLSNLGGNGEDATTVDAFETRGYAFTPEDGVTVTLEEFHLLAHTVNTTEVLVRHAVAIQSNYTHNGTKRHSLASPTHRIPTLCAGERRGG